tara:strand:- start:8287 stop:8991 length:705 start_codon:yes stop_codon:yes gene_type:complete
MSFLSAQNMTGGYDSVDILRDCSISVERGQIAVIVGPNGAGKSTAMKAIFGLIMIKEGSIFLEGEDISMLSPQQRVKKGMAFVPQTENVFTTLTVEENLEMGAYLRKDNIKPTKDQVFELFPILHEKRNQIAGELSGGQRQQVAVGRALMTNPSVLMLDEPTAGVSPLVTVELFERILAIKKAGVAVLMVEQNARQALEIADMGYVLVTGENKFQGTGKSLLENAEVRRSFLGG